VTDPTTMQRLAFIRYVFAQGVEQSQLPEPLSATALLHFHDSVELFLGLAADKHNVGKPKMDFMQLLGEVDTAIQPDRLEQRGPMRRLNDARVSLKHHGNILSGAQIDDYRTFTSSFFEENTPKVFGLAFNQVSMIDLIQSEGARQTLTKAQEAFDRGDNEDVVINAAIAFHQLLRDLDRGFIKQFYKSPYYVGEDFTFSRSNSRQGEPFLTQSRAQFEDKLVDAVESMQAVVRILSLGLDYRRYTKFERLTPVVLYRSNGYITQNVRRLLDSGLWPPSTESARFCIDFVIESAVRIRGADVDSVMQMRISEEQDT
jgi:hypothetical protein